MRKRLDKGEIDVFVYQPNLQFFFKPFLNEKFWTLPN